MPGSKVGYDTARRIVSLRRAGYTCRETAELCGVTESTVWYRMRASGLNGEIRARGKVRDDTPRNLKDAIEQYGVVTLEEGADGGYVCTIDDEVSGPEKGSIQGAIYAAARAYQEAENANDK